MKKLLEFALQQVQAPIIIITNHFDRGIVDPKIVFVNHSFLELTGFGVNELVGCSVTELFSKRSFAHKKVSSIKEQLSKNHSWSGELIICDKNKKHIKQNISIAPLNNAINDTLFYVCIFQKESLAVNGTCSLAPIMESIFELNTTFEVFNEHLPHGMWTTDCKGNVMFANTYMSKQLGIEQGTNLFDIATKDHKYVSRMFSMAKKSDGTTKKISFSIKTSKGEFWCTCKFWPIVQAEQVIGFAGIIEDATQELQLVRQLESLKVVQ